MGPKLDELNLKRTKCNRGTKLRAWFPFHGYDFRLENDVRIKKKKIFASKCVAYEMYLAYLDPIFTNLYLSSLLCKLKTKNIDC